MKVSFSIRTASHCYFVLNSMLSCGVWPRIFLLSPSSGQEIKLTFYFSTQWVDETSFSFMLVPIYQTARRHIPENANLYIQHHKNFKSRLILFPLLRCDRDFVIKTHGVLYVSMNNSPYTYRTESYRTVCLFCDYCTVSSHRQSNSYLYLCLHSNGSRLVLEMYQINHLWNYEWWHSLVCC
jgi:hypothetical protein